MPENSTSQATEQSPWPNPTVKQLTLLVGKWDIEVVFPGGHPPLKGGEALFEWNGEGFFLVQRIQVRGHDDIPKSYCMIGSDDSMGSYTMLYYDSRGVSRIYQMSLTDQEWKLWRDDPKFSQRFTGSFGDNGSTIKAAWEKSEDGKPWELDFSLTYTKQY